jgi:hypothetical protein
LQRQHHILQSQLEVRFAAIIIDGKSYAREMMIAVLGITAAGERHLPGLRPGATENAQICKELLRRRASAASRPTSLRRAPNEETSD